MSDPQSLPRHPVRLVAARTGLSPHVLRAWERRHHVVQPVRSEGGQRLYSDLDIARLRLLHRLTGEGHAIGRLAPLPLAELERLAADAAAEPAGAAEETGTAGAAEMQLAVLRAVRRLDDAELHAVLERAVVTLGVPGFLDSIAAPVLQAIGEEWREGGLGVAHEHLASAGFRRVLGWILGLYEVSAGAPRLVAATPSGQVHELGAMLAAAAAAAEGWGVTYLGADLPAAEISAAARQVRARVVALSLVFPEDDPGLLREVETIRRELPADVALVAGGAAAGPNRERLEVIGARVAASLGELRLLLRGLDAPAP